MTKTKTKTKTKKVRVECDCGASFVRVAVNEFGEIIWDDMTTYGTCDTCGEEVLVGRDEVADSLGGDRETGEPLS